MEGIITIGIVVAVVLFGVLVMVTRLYRKVEQGKAMIVNTLNSEPKVTFTGSMVIPIIYKMEIMDI